MNVFVRFINKIKNPFSKLRSNYLFKKRRKNFQEESNTVFQDFCKAFNDSETKFWLVFGTLLGAVRENGIISHDIDIDVGVKSNIDFIRLDESLQKYGFIKKRQIDVFSKNNESQGSEMTYSKKGVSIDIFIFYPLDSDENVYFTHAFYDRIVHENFVLYKKVFRIEFPLEGLINSTFIENDVLIPSNYESFLMAHYGPYFMIPNPKWKLTDSFSGKILENSLGFVNFKG